jgi:hypothetical protein
MVHALVISNTVRVAPAARTTRRAVTTRRSTTVPVRASSVNRNDDDAVSVSDRRAAASRAALSAVASVAAVVSAPVDQAHAAATELAQVRHCFKANSTTAPTRRCLIIDSCPLQNYAKRQTLTFPFLLPSSLPPSPPGRCELPPGIRPTLRRHRHRGADSFPGPERRRGGEFAE